VSAILSVLEARQKAVTAEQQARIEACSDLGVLDRWLSPVGDRRASRSSKEGEARRRAATLNDTGELFDQPE
jgi:hypothetical protein